MIREELEGVWYILLKDLKAYYFKPPNISWGILFPLVLALAFSLRNPAGLTELSPGLVAMAALFVGLRSLTFAMSIGLDDAWGWTRDGGMSSPLRWSDHIVLGGMRWLRRRSRAAVDVQPDGAIRMLPPEPPPETPCPNGASPGPPLALM